MEDKIEPHVKALTTDQITSMCQRGFGSAHQVESIRELGGGTFNSTYLITFTDQTKVILRVAPPYSPDTPWDEAFLMRREHAIQPFFAPVAARMPKTLFIDFTHQLVDRDYIFQSFIEGERWDEIMDDLTPAENNVLWEQFGKLLRFVHDVEGETFGLPEPDYQFTRWSQTVLDRIARTLVYAKAHQIAVPRLSSILDFVRAHPQPLDEIRVPRLLHGDLWSFNILIRRGNKEPAIVGILDADRASWGDPMADWTMFILAHAEKEEGHSRFWRAYGQPEDTPEARFRTIVYDGMYAGRAYVWAAQHNDLGTIAKAEGTLREVMEALPAMV